MRRILIPMLAVLVVGGIAAVPAHAASANSMLFPYQITELEDQDWEVIYVDRDLPFDLVKGDLFVGMMEVRGTNNKSGPGSFDAVTNGNTFTGIFVLEYTGTTETGLGPDDDETWYHFGPTATDWSDLGLSLPDVEDGTIALVVDNPNYSPSPVNSWVDPFAAGGLPASLATAIAGAKLWEIGFTGEDFPDEFWLANSIGVPPSAGLQWYGSLNVTKSYPGAVPLLKHDYYFNGGGGELLGLPGIPFSHVHLRGNYQGTTAGDNFSFDTDTDFWIKPTPEPGSLALLGLGLVGIGGVVYRRRRNK